MSDWIINSGKLLVDGTNYELLTTGIIDQYFEYFMDHLVPHHLRDDIHIFPCNFYNDLAVKGTHNGWFEGDNASLKDEEKRHKRVDFYLKETCLDVTSQHWFVAVIRHERKVTGSTASMTSEIQIMDSLSSQQRAKEAVKNISEICLTASSSQSTATSSRTALIGLWNAQENHKRDQVAAMMKELRMIETKQPNDLVDLFDGNHIMSAEFLSQHPVSSTEESLQACSWAHGLLS